MIRVVRGAVGAALLTAGLLAVTSQQAGRVARAATTDACAIPADFYTFEPVLRRTVAALGKGEAVRIVAVGGASTLGRAVGTPEKTWPAQMGKALAAQFPKARVSVVNAGVSRDTTPLMIARFERDVLVHKPTLVIWETGTTDAVRAMDIEQFRDSLLQGIAKLRKSGPEIVLMDMQYSRRSDLIVSFNRYVTVMRGVADMEDVPLFPRHEIMRYWAEMGVFNYGVTDRDARRDLAERVYACVGRAMADFIARGAPKAGR